jgi:hypothetical protein
VPVIFASATSSPIIAVVAARPTAVAMGIQIIIILPPLHLASQCQSRRKRCKLTLLVIAKTAVEGRLRIRQTRERGPHAGEAFSALAHAFRGSGRKPLFLPHLHPFASVVAQRPIGRLESGLSNKETARQLHRRHAARAKTHPKRHKAAGIDMRCNLRW